VLKSSSRKKGRKGVRKTKRKEKKKTSAAKNLLKRGRGRGSFTDKGNYTFKSPGKKTSQGEVK